MTAPRAQEPCPWCKHIPETWQEKVDGVTLTFVRHGGTGVCVLDQFSCLLELWNRRAPSADTRRLLDLIDRGTNALLDSINASGNDASTNAAIVRRMRREAGLDAAMTREGE